MYWQAAPAAAVGDKDSPTSSDEDDGKASGTADGR